MPIKFLLAFAGVSFLLTACNNYKSAEPAKTGNTDSANSIFVHPTQLVNLRGSRNIAELLSQGWELEDDIDAIVDNNSPLGIFPFRSFYLAADSTFLRNPRNAIDYGRWLYNDADKTITLHNQAGEKDVYKIGAIKATELIVINTGIHSITQLKFIAKGSRYGDKLQDPYYITNNQWRIAPKKPESDSLIRQRLKGYLNFYILFYRYNIINENKFVSFYGLPTCLEWYSGGIAMIKEAALADNWFACFYSKAQAIKAYKIMIPLLRKKYRWPERKLGWLKRNLSVVEQMYENL